MKLELNKTYIIRNGYSSPSKIKVLEVTESTYYIHNLDADSKYRILISEVERGWRIDEEMGAEEFNVGDPKYAYMFDITNKPDGISWIDVMKTIKGYKLVKG